MPCGRWIKCLSVAKTGKRKDMDAITAWHEERPARQAGPAGSGLRLPRHIVDRGTAAVVVSRRHGAAGLVDAFQQLEAGVFELLRLGVAADVVVEHGEMMAGIVQKCVVGLEAMMPTD